MPAQPSSGGDSLTRTTLLMDDNPSSLAIERAIAALKRVPGVLLAELGPGSPRAIVAHDAAVAAASLLEAAAKTGVHATLAVGTRAPVSSGAIGQLPLGKERERLLLLAAAVFVGFFAVSIVGSRLNNSHMLLLLVFGLAWAALIARSVISRRP